MKLPISRKEALIWFLLGLLLSAIPISVSSCAPKERHWADPARDKVDVDVTPKEKLK